MDRTRVTGALRSMGNAMMRLEFAASLVAIYIVWRLLARLRFGMDPTDESFYAALQHRFALGEKPYVDEVNLRQTFALITLPLYWLRFKVTKSADGAIHFLRIVYFLITCGTAVAIYRYARDRVGHALALLVGLVGIAFVPFNIPAPSYNTLGCTFFTAGIFLTLWRLSAPTPRWVHFAAGFAHGLSVISYPPIVIAVAVFAIATPWLDEDREHRFRNAGLYVAGGFVSLIFVLPHLGAAGPKGIREAIAYERSLTAPRTMEKFWAVLNGLWDGAPVQPRLVVVTLMFIVAARSFAVVRTLFLPCVVPGLAWWVNTPPVHRDTHVVALYFNVYAGLAGLAFLAVRRFDRDTLRFLFCCFIPSAAAGIVNGYSSDNGAMNAGLGAFPASILAMLLACELASNAGKRLRASWWVAAVTASVAYYHVELVYSYVYRDAPIPALTTRVRYGPFRGLYTTEANAAQTVELVVNLRKYADNRGRILSFYDFPAAYLYANMRFGMPSSWTDSRIAASPFMMDYYKQRLTGHGLVVRWPVANRQGRTELEALVEDPNRVLYRGSNGWVLYREPEPPR